MSLRIENDSYEANGRELRVTRFIPSELDITRNAILWLHGHRGNRQEFDDVAIASALDAGAISVTADLGGHGESEGNIDDISYNEHLEEVKGGYDYLAGLDEVQGRQIGIVAKSLTGPLAIEVTEDPLRLVSSLLLHAPSAYPDGIRDIPYGAYTLNIDVPSAIRKAITEYREGFSSATPNRTLRALRQFSGLVVIIESAKDDLVPRSVTRSYHQEAKNSILGIMPLTEHTVATEKFPKLIDKSMTVKWSREFNLTNEDIVKFALMLP